MVKFGATTNLSLLKGIKMWCCVIFLLWTNIFLWIWYDWHFDCYTLSVGESNS